MKAMLMTAAGGPEVLQLAEVPIPVLPSDKHMLVKLHAAAINPADYKRRKNGIGNFPLPAILGFDAAGVVEKIGAKVARFKPGDAVYFLQNGLGAGPGAYAEYTTVHEEYTAAKPTSLDFVQAAAVPLVFITCWEALHDRTHLSAGKTVLIHAGAGGTGHVAIQLAKQAGARVATTVSSAAKAAWVAELGAEHTINYQTEDFVDAALKWTNGRGVDIVFDTVGGDTMLQSIKAARVYGEVVSLLSPAISQEYADLAKLRNVSISYTLMLTPMMLSLHDASVYQRTLLEKAAAMIDAGQLAVKVSHILPLADAAKAHRLIESGHTSGKIVLSIG